VESSISKKLARAIGSVLGIDWDKTDLDEFHMGINAELEHGSALGEKTNVTKNDLFMTGRIALAHLIELPKYYTRLKKMETEAEAENKAAEKTKKVDEAVTLDIDVGDIVLGGKFKNKREVVKTIGTDDLGQPTINGKSLLKFRIEKKMPKEKQSKKTRDIAKEAISRMIAGEFDSFLSETTKVVQRERFPEFETSFLQELSERIAKAAFGGDASSIKVKITMRAKMESNATGAHGHHKGKRGGWHLIDVQRPTSFTGLQHVAETIAHEMTHVLQTHQRRLYTGYQHFVWEGERYEAKETPYSKRPWEQEAETAENVATQVLEQMKSEGKLQASKSDTMRKDAFGDSPTVAELGEMSPEELDAFLAHLKKSKGK